MLAEKMEPRVIRWELLLNEATTYIGKVYGSRRTTPKERMGCENRKLVNLDAAMCI